MELYSAHRSGHYSGGYETGGMPGSPGKGVFSFIKQEKSVKKLTKVLAFWGYFLYNDSARNFYRDIITPHTR
jgi:hypothetical protein